MSAASWFMINMDITLIYAAVVGGLLGSLVIINFLSRHPFLPTSARLLFRGARIFLTYPYIIRRHGWWAPWTLGDIIIQLVYLGINLYCLGCSKNVQKAGLRAGILCLINLIPTFLGPHIGFLADLLGLSLGAFRQMHRSAGLMSFGLVILHAVAAVLPKPVFVFRGVENISGIVVSYPPHCPSHN